MLPTSVTPNISAGLGIGAQRFQLNNLLRSELNNQVSDLSYAAGAGLGGGIFGGLAGVVNSGVRGAALPAFGQQISAVQAAAPFLDAAAVQGGRGLANAQGVLNSVFPGAGVGLQAGNAGNVLQRVSASGFNSGNNFNVLSAILGLGGNGGGWWFRWWASGSNPSHTPEHLR